MKAMIFAAGLGTRLKPLTDTMPKALVQVAEKSLIQHVIEKLSANGFNDIVINVHHFADMIESWCHDYLENQKLVCSETQGHLKLSFSDERAELLETGGGIRHAAKILTDNNNEERFLIHNVDILSNVNLLEFWDSGINADAILLVSERQTQRYLIFNSTDRLVGWTNIKTGEVKTPYPEVLEAFDPNYTAPINSGAVMTSPFFKTQGSGPYYLYAFAGIHQMSTRLLKAMKHWPEKFSIIDFYLTNCKEYSIKKYIQPNLKLMDIGKLDTLDQANDFVLEL